MSRAHGAGRAGVPAVLLATLLFLLLAWWSPLAIGADGPIQVRSDEHTYSFSKELRFDLLASSENPIVEVILFYGRDGDRLVRRIYPGLTPGKEVSVQHTEQLEAGQFAPGTLLRYWWELRTAVGESLMTEARTFEYADDSQRWQTLSGKRVDLYWYGKEEARATEMLERAEATLVRLESEVGLRETRRVRIYVYSSQKDMLPALARRGEGYDDHVVTLGVAVDEQTLLLLGSHREARITLAHELSHVVVGLATDNAYTDLPRWLDEGLAMYAQGELGAGNRSALQQAIRSDSLPSIRYMSSYSGQASDVDLFYGAAHSVVSFMIEEFGRDKTQQLLAVFAEGTRQEEALQRVYGFGLDHLDNRWRASLGLGPRRRASSETAMPGATAQPSAVSPTASATQPRSSPRRSSQCTWSAAMIALSALGLSWWGMGPRAYRVP